MGASYIYPREVAVCLPPPPSLEAQTLQVSEVLAGSARTCQRDLYLYWSAVHETHLQLTSAGLIARRVDLRRVAGQMLVSEVVSTGSKESDFRRLFFLRQLATGLGLLQLDFSEETSWLAATGSPSLFASAAADRVRASFASWRDGTWWNELWVTYRHGSTRASGSLADPAPARVVQARQHVLAALVESAKSRNRQAQRAGNAHEKAGPWPLSNAIEAPDSMTPTAEPGHTEPWIGFDDVLEYLRDHDDEFLIERETAEQRRYGYYGQRTGNSAYLYNDLGWSGKASRTRPLAGTAWKPTSCGQCSPKDSTGSACSNWATHLQPRLWEAAAARQAFLLSA